MKHYNLTRTIYNKRFWTYLLILCSYCALPLIAQAQLQVKVGKNRPCLPGVPRGTGTIQLEIESGTAPYSIHFTQVPEGFAEPKTYTAKTEKITIWNLPSGNYGLEISDASGSIVPKQAKVEEAPTPSHWIPDTGGWTQRFTTPAGHPDWVSMRFQFGVCSEDPNPIYFGYPVDSIFYYFEYAFCMYADYMLYTNPDLNFPGKENAKPINWVTLNKYEGEEPTFQGEYGLWKVTDSFKDYCPDSDGKFPIVTKEVPHLFAKISNGMTANEMVTHTPYEQMVIACRPKGATDPKYAKFITQVWGKNAYDPNPWLEASDLPLYDPAKRPYKMEYRPKFRIKEEFIESLTFPVEVRSSALGGVNPLGPVFFTKEDAREWKEFNKEMSWKVANTVVMKDAAGKVATMRFSNKITDISTTDDEAGLILRDYYRDTRPDTFDKRTNLFLPGAEPHIEGHYFCEGTMDVVFALAIEDGALGWYFQIPAAGAQITLIKAPADYEPQNEYQPKLNVPITIPKNHTSWWIYPFPNDAAPADNPYAEPCWDVKLPPGHYDFKVTYMDMFGEIRSVGDDHVLDHGLLYDHRIPKFEYGPERANIKPVIDPVDCKNLRVYPFRGAKSPEIILRDGKPVITVATVKLYDPMNKAFFPNETSKWESSPRTKVRVIADPDVLNGRSPEDLYVDIPWADYKIEITYTTENAKDLFWWDITELPCLDLLHTREIEVGKPTYDRDNFEAYICKSGAGAHISLMPIKTAGRVFVELREMDNKTVIASKVREADDNGPIVFDLTADQVRPEYYLYMRTEKCDRENEGEKITLIDLSSEHILIHNGEFPKYCEGSTILLKIPKVSAQSKYSWTLPDGSTIEGPELKIENASKAHAGHYKAHITNVLCDQAAIDEEIDFQLIISPPELWWRKDAGSADWNSTENWADSQGKPITAIPASCTNVHIPAVVDKFFPDLDPAKTMRQSFGEPVCNDIYFHYGAALGNPQLLSSYARAFIDYNFGIMQADGTVKPYEDPQHLEANALLLERDRWYMLSTPIKNVYAGDFSLAGYPLTYQRYLKLLPVNADGSLTEASFDQAINTQRTPIADSNLALALKVVGYQSNKIGASDHKNLNGLQGIIRLPFYETNELNRRKEFYPLHRYNPDELLSLFVYFNERDLKPVSKIDEARRDPEQDYRFVFEDSATKAIGSIADDTAGEATEGYTLKLKKIAEVPQLMALVGNPFMTPISFDKLYEANANNIEPYYYLFTDGAWHYYHVNAVAPDATSTQLPNGQIAPLQAFVVKVKMGVSQLHFPTTGDQSVLLPPKADGTADYELRNGNSATSLADQRAVSLTVSDVKGAKGFAMLLPEATVSATPALIAPSTMQTAPVAYFVNPTDGSCNFVQTDAPYTSLELGIYAPTDGMLTLDFRTMSEKPFDKLTLYDRLRGTEQDLLTNPSYSYAYSPRDGRRFELRMSYAGVRSNKEVVDPQDELQIERTATGYRISYGQGIAGYQLYSVQGYLLERATTDGQTQVEIEMPETEVVLLDVQSTDGLRWIKKLQR